MLALDVFSFCFPDDVSLMVTGGICPSVFFINYASICTGIRRNLNEMCLFSPLGYYHMTYIGKQNS